MDCIMPGFPVPELTQAHVHQVGDAIQPSHPLSSPSSPTFNLSQHHSLFQWVSSSHQVAKYLSFSFSLSNEYSELISFIIDQFDCALLTTPKPLTVWIPPNCGKFLKRWDYQTTLPASWEIFIQVKKHQLELDMEQQTGSKWGKEYIKAVYCHPA